MIIAAAQLRSVTGDIAGNALRMARLITEAAERSAGLVVFSELALTHYDLRPMADDPARAAVLPDDPRLAPIREACRATGVAAVVNGPGRSGEDGALPTIASFVYGPDGALLTRYDKRHLAETESAVFAPGSAHGRFTLGGIRFALATCCDSSFPEVAERAVADGCRVYLSSAFHRDAEGVARYGRLAREHGLHVLLANGTGVGSPGPAAGLSGCWLPSGERVASAGPGGDGAELVLSDVRDAITLMADPAVAAVPVRECGEPLVDVRTAAPELMTGHLKPGAGGEGDGACGAFAYLRKGVLRRLLAAQEALPDGWRLRFVEGYRPPALQRHYFTRYADGLRAAHPDWDDARIHRAASRYVSPPEIAPHSAGGAVDLTLVTSDGDEVDMGTPIDASPEESGGACYTSAPDVSPAALAHRRILAAALRGVGLVNYPTEWWHWSYGDRYWALETGAEHALYGPRELGAEAATDEAEGPEGADGMEGKEGAGSTEGAQNATETGGTGLVGAER
ncbi:MULTISPECIES: nitrilase-related carbon-nitrogen hydrolase [unclassified Streptomyces]|uniref:nitrilase-related carbon-nitrogen hydrolase n=1 Tax=unclassified Streptomyces TaxID=2593676 RepID=UPI00036EA42D|nr:MULTISPECIES: nitrilase-related carbon-nitrogen hydrolase [unclassified Streptomyces]MYT28341.1 peptidase M15D vanX D-ala-D-ala dipeptidase [Streptomyces sp. SID8354]